MNTSLWTKVSFLAASAAGALLLSACGSQAAAPAAPSGAEPATGAPSAPAAPKVNRVVLAIDPPTTEGNETRMLGQTTLFQLNPMYEYLIGYDATNGKFVPALATEWKLEPDGTSYRFALRKGVQFQKGFGEFTSKDVLYTWQDLTREGSLHGESTWYKAQVLALETPNDYEAVFKMNPKGSANFIHGLSRAEHVMEIISKAAHDKNGDPTMQGEPTAGTGPYQYKERRQAEYVRYERRADKHWANYQIDFPEFELRFAKEASTRVASLLAGEVHMAALPQDLQKRAEQSGFKVLKGKVAGPRAFLNISCCFIKDPKDLNSGYLQQSPLQDVRVRQALNKAINRDELNKAFFGGKGETMYNYHLHPTRPGWNPDWEKNFPTEYGYDVAKAKQLLADAGYGPGKALKTTLHIQNFPNVPGAPDIIESIAGYWRAAGVEPALAQEDNSEITAKQRAFAYSNDFFMSATSSGELIGSNAYFSSIPPRNSGMEDPIGDALLLKINDELDGEKQAVLWRQYGDHVYKTQYAIPLFWIPAEVVINPKFVADWVFPGSITGTWTHQENLRAAK